MFLYRVALSIVYILGLIAFTTFSRGGAIGFIVGTLVALHHYEPGLISRRVMGFVAVALSVIAIMVLLYFGARPESFSMRFNLFEAELKGYSQDIPRSRFEQRYSRHEGWETGIKRLGHTDCTNRGH